MPLSHVSQARHEIRHNRCANAYATNLRTGKTNIPVIVDPPVMRPLDMLTEYATHLATLNSEDWQSGDHLTLTWKKQPGRVSSPREVKYIIPQEDGIPWQYLVVLGTFDLEALPTVETFAFS